MKTLQSLMFLIAMLFLCAIIYGAIIYVQGLSIIKINQKLDRLRSDVDLLFCLEMPKTNNVELIKMFCGKYID